MELYRPEVHSMFLRPFLDDTRDALGAQMLGQLLEPFGAREEQLRDETAWVSLEFCEAFFEHLMSLRNDPTIFDRCGRMVLEPRYLGIVRPVFRAFGSTRFTLGQAVHSTQRFNKVGRFRILATGRGFARLEYASLPGAPRERGGHVCQARAAQLAAIPTMFDLAPARTAHVSCMQHGAATCIYEFTWREPGSRRTSLSGLAVGALWAWALTRQLGLDLIPSLTAAVGLPLGCWALGRVAELKRDIADRARELSESNEALARSLKLTELRYAEVLEAKNEVEHKVAVRTTEVREANARLEGALREVEGLARAKADFFANVSHELRTPLTLISAPLDSLLQRSDLTGEARRHLEMIQRSAGQLRRLIDQLLDLEKIDAGRVRLGRVPVDPVKLAGTMVETFRAAALAHRLELTAAGARQAPPLLLDGQWMESALGNLLGNALKFARSAVELRVLDQEGAVTFEVEDDGPGIPPSDLELIFERFAQSGAASKRRLGTGLGLALAREAARLHDGELTVRSEMGKGSVFSLRLPRMATVAEAMVESDSAPYDNRRAAPVPLPAADTPTPAPAAGLDAPLVVVVEDEDDLRHFVRDLLAERYRVEVARDGAEGLALIRRLGPDAVISDLAMPELDGLELCRQVRSDPALGTIPFILLTAWNQQPRVLDGFRAGADDYVAKPFHPMELLARVDVHVRLRRLVREMAHKERLAALGVMAASLAHQIRNPLTAISSGVFGFRSKLARTLDTRAIEVLDVMSDCTARIERLIVALLDLSRLDREEQTTFKPADTIRASVRLVQARLRREARISEEIEDDLELRGRPGDMGHVFLNLIDNAVRAIDEAGAVQIRATRHGGQFVFEVGDSGPGIPPEQAEWIFSPFTTRRPAGEGTGLGLYIAREVVREHGGRISIERSRLGGALFRVEVPLPS
jgi:signal transduction histidine kinase